MPGEQVTCSRVCRTPGQNAKRPPSAVVIEPQFPAPIPDPSSPVPAVFYSLSSFGLESLFVPAHTPECAITPQMAFPGLVTPHPPGRSHEIIHRRRTDFERKGLQHRGAEGPVAKCHEAALATK